MLMPVSAPGSHNGNGNGVVRWTYATGTLTLAAQPTVGDTMTIGATVYTFAVPFTVNPGDLPIGANLAATQASVLTAINDGDSNNSPNTDVHAALAWVGNTLLLTALAAGAAGNSVVTTETFTSASNFFSAATLTGGADGTATGDIHGEHLTLKTLNPQVGLSVLDLYDANGNLVGHLDSDGGFGMANENFQVSEAGQVTIDYDSDGNPLAGNSIFRFAANAAAVLNIQPGAGFNMVLDSLLPTDVPLTINAATNHATDLFDIYEGVTFAKAFRVLDLGAIVTSQHAAPADGNLSASEMAIWFDDTNGAAKLMIKAKTADGTVVTGNVALT